MGFKRKFILLFCVLVMCSCSVGNKKEDNKKVQAPVELKKEEIEEKIKKTIEYLELKDEKVEKVLEEKVSEKGNIEYTINGDSVLIFKKDGTLKRMNRISEVDTSKNGKILDASRKKEILSIMEKIISEGFTVREEQDVMDNTGTKIIFSNDKNGVVNRFNIVSIMIENSTGKIVGYKRVDEFTEDVSPKISEKDAKSIAEDYIKSKNLSLKMESVRLEINKVGVNENTAPKLLYIVRYNDGYEVWINAIEGKVEFLNSYK